MGKPQGLTTKPKEIDNEVSKTKKDKKLNFFRSVKFKHAISCKQDIYFLNKKLEVNPDIVSISKHWATESKGYILTKLNLSNSVVGNCFKLSNYEHGGSLILVKKSIQFETLIHLRDKSEDIIAETTGIIPKEKLIIISTYKAPRADLEVLLGKMEEILDFIFDKNTYGD
ncbi:hypothetical protein WA026_020526 [Henosepilachna vigintioctopunctata]|uniref:Uncharacterized protein n=1 Tax=Henosepilachna vigintioctopunctata TaxID=420089 RepID=A0AAW1VFK7_9CUCU